MTSQLNDQNIIQYQDLVSPEDLQKEYPLTPKIHKFIIESRKTIQNIINGNDPRYLCIVGPCSIHNIDEAKSYGQLLKTIIDKSKEKLFIVMRVYLEKPRTTIGWKGFLNDPNLNNSFDVNLGLRKSRELLLYLNDLGVSCGCEILDTITPQYLSDLYSWGAIGARTTESQVHRQIVSGLSFPIGFKNGIGGDIQPAINSLVSSSEGHSFMGINQQGKGVVCQTRGNLNTHIILRGSCQNGPNYTKPFIMETEQLLSEMNKKIEKKNAKKINQKIMIDCSHGNSNKDYRNQSWVLKNIIKQIKEGNQSIKGIMLESNINEGSQSINLNYNDPNLIKYGVSLTDSCIGFQETEKLLQDFKEAMN